MPKANHPVDIHPADPRRFKKGLLVILLVLDLTYLGGVFLQYIMHALHVAVLAIELLFEKFLVRAFKLDHDTAVVVTAYLGLTVIVLGSLWLSFLAYRFVRRQVLRMRTYLQHKAETEAWVGVARRPGTWLTGGALTAFVWLFAL